MAEKPARLDTWKEIARYLDRDVRTVMRWEQEHELPVHRVPPGGKGRSVFAFADELDDWLQGPGAASEPANQGNDSGGAGSWRRTPARRFSLLAGALGFAAVGASLVALWPRSDLGVVEFTYAGDSLIALGPRGEAVWSHRLDSRFRRLPGQAAPQSHLIYDLDGDGRREILVNDNFYVGSSSVEEGRLFCFSSSGELRWTFLFGDTLNFGDDQFLPPWRAGPLSVYQSAAGPRIAWALRHVWWPSLLLVLDGAGTPIDRFVHPGWILSLAAVESDSGPRLLAGGVSNAHQAAMLAILDGDRVSGSPPQSDDVRYSCRNCPPGHPLQYLLFPRSELNVAAGLPHNRLNGLDITDFGYSLRALEAEAPLPTSAERIFEMGRDFSIRRVKFSDGFWSYHRVQELESRLGHSAEDCPERDGVLVRVWTRNDAWRDVSVPTG